MVELSNKDTVQVLKLLAHLSGLYSSKGSPRKANISRVAFLLKNKIEAKVVYPDKKPQK